MLVQGPTVEITCTECEEPEVVPVPPTPPQTLISWLSCPQAVTFVGDNLWFITTDDGDPTDTAYFAIWNGSYWETIYSTTTTNTDPVHDPSGDYWQWDEPPIDVYTKGDITVVVLYRMHYYASYDEFADGADVFAFSGDTLLGNTYIVGETIPAVAGPLYKPTYGQHSLLIDSTDKVHLILGTLNYDTYDYHVFDFTSSDNGVSFVPVDVTGAQGFLGEPYFLTETSAGVLYMCQNATTNCIWKSLDHGATWAVHANGAFKTFVKDFRLLNDVFFAIDRNAVTGYIYIKRSTDGSTWSTVHSVAKETTFSVGVLGYDGTYYYAVCNYRNSTNPSGDTGYNEVYRSSDGLNWSTVSTFSDYAIKPPTNYSTSSLAVSGSRLAYTFWYAETIVGSDRLMAVWESVDRGVTWTVLSTLFSDQTGGSGAPD